MAPNWAVEGEADIESNDTDDKSQHTVYLWDRIKGKEEIKTEPTR